MISKYKNAQLVFKDGVTPVKIKRVIKRDEGFFYELKDTGEIIEECRLSLVKSLGKRLR